MDKDKYIVKNDVFVDVKYLNVRKDYICENCKSNISKGSRAILRYSRYMTTPNKLKRKYYCLNCSVVGKRSGEIIYDS